MLTTRSAYVWNFNLYSYVTVLFWSIIGPFSLLFTSNTGFTSAEIYLIGIPNLFALFLHPLKPNIFTAILTIVAFAFWLFQGFAGAYISV